MLHEPDQPIVTDRIEEGSDIGIYNPVHLHTGDPRRECVQRIVLATPRTETVRKPKEVFFIDRIEYLHERALDDFVFQCHNSQRALPPVGFRDVLPPRW